MPALHGWTNADVAEPITGVLAMGSLQNTLRGRVGEGPVATRLVAVGDALCHTDPVLALGLSFSLIHASALAAALREHEDDLDGAALAFDAAVRPDIEERFAQASNLDDARSRRWSGEQLDIWRRDGGAYETFAIVAGYAAGRVDPEIFRAVVRRHTFLDRVGRLDADPDLLARIERIVAALPAPVRPGPERDELVEVVARA